MSKEDLNYIETEDEHITLVKRALQDEFDNGFDSGFEKGKTEGKIEGKTEGKIEGKTEVVLLSHEEGASIAFIAKITQLREEQVVDILKKHKKI